MATLLADESVANNPLRNNENNIMPITAKLEFSYDTTPFYIIECLSTAYSLLWLEAGGGSLCQEVRLIFNACLGFAEDETWRKLHCGEGSSRKSRPGLAGSHLLLTSVTGRSL
jgi:hypothetical protein